MPQIFPFRGYRYSSQKFRSLGRVLSPPYDVISPKERDRLYGLSPYNFVRLDFKKATHQEKNVYDSAARDLGAWIKEKITVPEDDNAFYVYLQDYKNLEGKNSRRIGFIGLVKLKGASVQKHEKTLDGPKKDRTALIKRIKANLSPIFTIFKDKENRVYRELLLSARGKCVSDEKISGVRHRLYLEKDPKRISRIQSVLRSKPMVIADGHHRFEVSYKYRSKQPYIMTYLCPAEGNDLTIYPTHRVLSLKAGWKDRLRGILKKNFVMWEAVGLKKVTVTRGDSHFFGDRGFFGHNTFMLVLREGKKVYSFYLTPKTKKSLLDVAVAQELLIAPLLGTEDIAKTDAVRYTRDEKQAVDTVKSGEADAAIILSKIPVHEVIRLSEKGIFLPQKSTYFYPKLLSGLVFYKF